MRVSTGQHSGGAYSAAEPLPHAGVSTSSAVSRSTLVNRPQNRFLAAVGDSSNPNTFSGIPFFFLRAATAAGLIDAAIPVSKLGRSLQLKRVCWNLRQALTRLSYGGFQYTHSFLEWLWSPSREIVNNSAIINCFQLYPPSILKNSSVEKWFFIDQTLSQLFESGLYGRTPSSATVSKLLAYEKANYLAATRIIAHSRWAAQSLTNEYGIDASKVTVVVPGANLAEEDYNSWSANAGDLLSQRMSRIASGRPHLVFVGKDWKRKGLTKLIDVVVASKSFGLEPTLRVLGCDQSALPLAYRSVPGVEWLGFIAKQSGTSDFIQSVAACDIGCLLSLAEAGGIALREYHALGLATLASDVGGISDHVVPKATVLVPVDADPSAIAAKLAFICHSDIDIVDRAWKARRSVLWQNSIEAIAQIWPYLPEQ